MCVYVCVCGECVDLSLVVITQEIIIRQVGMTLLCIFIFNIEGKKSSRSLDNKAGAMAVSSENPDLCLLRYLFWLAVMRGKCFTIF